MIKLPNLIAIAFLECLMLPCAHAQNLPDDPPGLAAPAEDDEEAEDDTVDTDMGSNAEQLRDWIKNRRRERGDEVPADAFASSPPEVYEPRYRHRAAHRHYRYPRQLHRRHGHPARHASWRTAKQARPTRQRHEGAGLKTHHKHGPKKTFGARPRKSRRR